MATTFSSSPIRTDEILELPSPLLTPQPQMREEEKEADHTATNSIARHASHTLHVPSELENGHSNSTGGVNSSSFSSSEPASAEAKKRKAEYEAWYPMLQPIWNVARIGATKEILNEFLQFRSLHFHQAVLEKFGITHSNVRIEQCRLKLLEFWHRNGTASLLTPQQVSTPKKRRYSESPSATAASSIPPAATSEERPANRARRALTFQDDSNQLTTVADSSISSLCLLGANASVSISLLDKTVKLKDLVSSLLKLEDKRIEILIPDTCAEEIQLKLQRLPEAFPENHSLYVPATVLVRICVAILQQDHLRKFAEALATLDEVHKEMVAMEQNHAEFLKAPLCQALFAHLEVRMGSAYRVNKQFRPALSMCQAAENRARRQFLGTESFRSLRANILCLLCSAYRCYPSQESNDTQIWFLELAQGHATDALLLYEGLGDQDGIQWAASELIKVLHAKGKPEEVKELHQRLCTPKLGESIECCHVKWNRLSFEGIKECLKLRHANTAQLRATAVSHITLAIEGAATAEQTPHGPRCCCAIQAKHLRKALHSFESTFARFPRIVSVATSM